MGYVNITFRVTQDQNTHLRAIVKAAREVTGQKSAFVLVDALDEYAEKRGIKA